MRVKRDRRATVLHAIASDMLSPVWSVEWMFQSDLRAASDARSSLGEYAAALRPEVAVDAWDVALLLMSELVTNAVQHGQGRVHVRVYDDDLHFRIEVSDTGLRNPGVRPVDISATDGRGLLLVEALASTWGIRWFVAPDVNPAALGANDASTGKSVWFELPSMTPAA